MIVAEGYGHFNENVTDFIDKEMSERTRGKGELRETGISSTSSFYQLIVKQLSGANNRKKIELNDTKKTKQTVKRPTYR